MIIKKPTPSLETSEVAYYPVPARRAELKRVRLDRRAAQRPIQVELLPSSQDAGISLPDQPDAGEVSSGTVDAGPEPEVFDTINEAIAAAAPGDLIEVTTGNYPEQLEINIPLTLRGNGAAIVSVRISATGVQLDNFRVEAAPVDGIRLEPGAGAVLGEMIITRAAGCGIIIEDGSTLVVRDSEIYDNGTGRGLDGDGIKARGPTASVTVENNRIDDNDGYGIHCEDDADIDVCELNDHDGNDRGWSDCDAC